MAALTSPSLSLCKSLLKERRLKFMSSTGSKRDIKIYPPHCLQTNSDPKHMVHNLEAEALRVEELQQGVRKALLCNGLDLTLIDSLQHLGISYHFEDEINTLLEQSNYSKKHDDQEDDLFLASLRFRLLRQGGHSVTQDVFLKFMDEEGNFKQDLRKDLLGLLSLHEASYLGAREEEVLSKAMVFTKKQLERSKRPGMNPTTASDFGNALENPRHRRMERLEARNYIEKQVKEHGRSSSNILELAILDFNMVQKLYQSEIVELESWWRELGLAKKLPFARDRPLECFMWTVGLFPEPRFSRCRVEVAKAVAILHVIDDIYDTYGTDEELLLFTDAVCRWGVDATEKLPEYMKIGYMAIYNTTNEIGHRILVDHGVNAIPYLRKTWVDLCEAYLLEGRWFKEGVPTLDEYMSVSVTTAGTYLAFVHGFFLMGMQITKQSLDFVNSSPSLFTSSGKIFRLWDDLGTTKAEQLMGDDASSLNCYMKHNTNTSEDDARNHVRFLIHETWKELNRDSLITATPLPQSMVKVPINLARTAQAIYQHGDDDTAPSVDETVEYLFKRPIVHHDNGLYSNKTNFCLFH